MKSSRPFFMTIALIAAVFVIFGTGKTAAAAMKQDTQTQTEITVSWDAESFTSYHITEYFAQIGTDYSEASAAPKVSIAPNATSYTFSGLQPGTSYYARISYMYTTDYDQTPRENNLTSTYVYTLPGKVDGVNQTRWYKYIESVDFSWNKQSGVDGYEWNAYNSKGKKIKSEENSYGSGSFSIDNNVIYTVEVRAYKTINDKKYFGDWSAKAYLFTQPTVKAMKVSKGKMTVKWGKIAGATGYTVYASTNNKKFVKICNVGKKKTSIKFKKIGKKKIKPKKPIYVYIASNKKVGENVYTTGKNYTYKYEKGNYSETYAESE